MGHKVKLSPAMRAAMFGTAPRSGRTYAALAERGLVELGRQGYYRHTDAGRAWIVEQIVAALGAALVENIDRAVGATEKNRAYRLAQRWGALEVSERQVRYDHAEALAMNVAACEPMPVPRYPHVRVSLDELVGCASVTAAMALVRRALHDEIGYSVAADFADAAMAPRSDAGLIDLIRTWVTVA